MIIKVQTQSGYALFDQVDHFTYHYFQAGNSIGVSADTYDYTDLQRPLSPEYPALEQKNAVCMFLSCGRETKQVLALEPVFILNNDGKTIDKL